MEGKLKNPNSNPKTSKIWNLEFYHWPFSKGFTLIEILVVITIIGILSSVTTFSLKKFNDKGNDARRKGDLKAIQTAAISYYQDNDKFPPNPVSYPANAYSSDIDLGTGWIPGISTYINKLPKDPLRAGIINHFAKNILEPAIGSVQHLAGIFNKSSQSPKTSSNPQVAAMQVMTIRPNGAGTNTAWTTQFPNSTLHWDKVDEPTSDTDSTYIESTTDGQVDTYTHAASGIPAGSTISNVRVCVNSKYVTASTNNIAAPAILTGGGVVWSDQVSTSAYANHCADWATNPVGGVSWTIAAVDAAQFGVRKSYPTALIRVTQSWMEVTYNTNQPAGACENKDNIYCYTVNTDRDFFVIWAELDNANDLDAVGQAKAICNRAIPANTTFNYCVESSSL